MPWWSPARKDSPVVSKATCRNRTVLVWRAHAFRITVAKTLWIHKCIWISFHCIKQFAPCWLCQTYPYFVDTNFLCHIFPSSLDPISVTCMFSIDWDSATVTLLQQTASRLTQASQRELFHKCINDCMSYSLLNFNFISRLTVKVAKTFMLVFVRGSK